MDDVHDQQHRCDDASAPQPIDAHLLEQYRSARVVVEYGGAKVLATELARQLSTTVFVVTAYNPGSTALDADENHSRDQALGEELDRRAIMHMRSCSKAPSGAWREKGYALIGVSADEVIELAQSYGQLAIFKARTNGRLEVLTCAR